MEFTLRDVQRLREASGEGMPGCRAALEMAKDFDDALAILQGRSTTPSEYTPVALSRRIEAMEDKFRQALDLVGDALGEIPDLDRGEYYRRELTRILYR